MFCYKTHIFCDFIEKKAENVQMRSSFYLCESDLQISYVFLSVFLQLSFSFVPKNCVIIPSCKNICNIIFKKRAKFIPLQQENKSTKPKIEPKIVLC